MRATCSAAAESILATLRSHYARKAATLDDVCCASIFDDHVALKRPISILDGIAHVVRYVQNNINRTPNRSPSMALPMSRQGLPYSDVDGSSAHTIAVNCRFGSTGLL